MSNERRKRRTHPQSGDTAPADERWERWVQAVRTSRGAQPTTQSITLALPVPPHALGPNARAHWAVRARLTRALRAVAREAARQALDAAGLGTPRASAATVTLTLVPAAARRRDRDNILASAKAAFDGLADAGVVDDDSALTHLPVVIGPPRKPAHMRLRVEWETAARLDSHRGSTTR